MSSTSRIATKIEVKLQFFSFGEKLIFDKTGVQTLRLFERFAFRYHHFNNMGHEAN